MDQLVIKMAPYAEVAINEDTVVVADDHSQTRNWIAEWRAFLAENQKYFRSVKKPVILGVASFVILVLIIAYAAHKGTSVVSAPSLPALLPNATIFDPTTPSILLCVTNTRTNSSTFRRFVINETNTQVISSPFKNQVASLEVDMSQNCIWFTSYPRNSTKEAFTRSLYYLCQGATVQYAIGVEGIGFMTEAIDWVGHNVYLFNNRTSLTVLHGYNGSIENLKLKTESEDIHPLFHPSSIRVDPINGMLYYYPIISHLKALGICLLRLHFLVVSGLGIVSSHRKEQNGWERNRADCTV